MVRSQNGRFDRDSIATSKSRLSSLRADSGVVRDRGRAKIKRLQSSLPLYIPSRHPVGREFTFATGVDLAAEADGVDCREVLPSREVPTGDQSFILAPPLHAFAIQPSRLVTDSVLFRGVITNDDVVIIDVSVDSRGASGHWPSFSRLQRFPSSIQLGDAVTLLTGGGGATNYAHWLYDVLPRLHLLNQAGLIRANSYYIVPPLDREFKLATLTRLGIDPERCVEIGGPALIEAARLSAVSGHRNHGRVEPWIPEFLRAAFLREGSQTGRRIYVNRRDTRLRRVLNEGQLESALAARGFVSISASDYDFQEKMDFYSSSDIVVAPYGAGLANIAFCPPGAQIVELQGDDWSNSFYEDIARGAGLEYRAVKAFRTASSPLLPDIARHLEVDVERVIAVVDSIMP